MSPARTALLTLSPMTTKTQTLLFFGNLDPSFAFAIKDSRPEAIRFQVCCQGAVVRPLTCIISVLSGEISIKPGTYSSGE